MRISMDHDSRHSVSVAGVIVDDQRRALLVQRRDNGRWEAPGGVLELEEDVVSGLKRELREETGLEVEPELLTGVYKNMTLGIVALVFRCRPAGGTLTETDETRAFRWVTAQEVQGLSAEAFAVRVLDAMQSDGRAAVRQHDGVRVIGSAL
ncbi:NUDIX domain-containing protein [Nonomuraea sp. NPDC050478]|uniref:NUDIX domain-containing protein n=1 Tax=Nonomuraea sp. NPDC050478 TaxID=3364365 RepID=UPI00379803C0